MADHFPAPGAWASFSHDDNRETETSTDPGLAASRLVGAQPMPLSLAAQGVQTLDIASDAKQRITLAWMNGREPVVLPLMGGGHATVVVVWPTTPDGQLSGWGEPVAMVAHVFEPQLQEILLIDQSWPLVHHDVWVQREQFDPCAFSLRRAPRFSELRHHVEVLVRVLMTFGGAVGGRPVACLAG